MTTLVEETFLGDNDMLNGDRDKGESDIDDLEREIEILANKYKGNGINKMDIFKNLLNNLQEQNTVLTEDIHYLRHESEGKTQIINRLLDLINTRSLTTNDTTINKDYVNNDTSSYNKNISKYNAGTSNYNNGSIFKDIGVQCIRNDFSNDAFNDLTTSSTVIEQQNSDAESFNMSIKRTTLDEQIKRVRIRQHEQFIIQQLNTSVNNQRNNETSVKVFTNNEDKLYESISNDDSFGSYDDDEDIDDDSIDLNTHEIPKWKHGTVCILGDSILCNLDEKRLGRDSNVKVRCYPGGTVEDLFDHVKPILKRSPTFIILHIGTNNATNQNSRTIMNNILKLKLFIETNLPSCTVIISTPVIRQDNVKANLTIIRLNSLLRQLNIPIVDNSNIDTQHLGKKGLHLSNRGTGRLALNLISHIRCL